VVECFELHAGGLRVDPPSWLPLLCASIDVPTGLGAVISTDRFTLGTIFAFLFLHSLIKRLDKEPNLVTLSLATTKFHVQLVW
jgi:hypothetical protein